MSSVRLSWNAYLYYYNLEAEIRVEVLVQTVISNDGEADPVSLCLLCVSAHE